jgi:hypothetical protein
MFSTDLDEHMNRKINYTSLWCENEILPLIAAKTRQELLPKQGDFYALMADETCDISTIEQMSICFRFVDDDLIIHENFLGFYDLKITNAETIFNLLLAAITKDFNLPIQNMIAQAYDGAATMAGSVSGVQTRFLQINPVALFVHCYAHKLNLGLNDACGSIKEVSDVLLDIQNVSVFIERSAKRHALFQHIQAADQKITLKKLCETRWASRYQSLKAIVKTHTSIFTFLEIADDDNDHSVGATARGIQKKIKTMNFIFYSTSLLLLFERIHTLSCLLQSKDLCVKTATDLVEKILKSLLNLKNDKDEYDKIYEQCLKVCEDNRIDIEEDRRGKRRKGAEANNYSHQDVYQNKFQTLIQVFYDYINKRFDKTSLVTVIELSKCLLTYDLKEILY